VAASNPKTRRRWGVNWRHSPLEDAAVFAFYSLSQALFSLFLRYAIPPRILPFRRTSMDTAPLRETSQTIASLAPTRYSQCPGEASSSCLVDPNTFCSRHLCCLLAACTVPRPEFSTGKKLPAGPPAPQSTHYPILLLAFGNDPNWSLRIGLKGPERLDRPGYHRSSGARRSYHEAGADAWTLPRQGFRHRRGRSPSTHARSVYRRHHDTLTPAPPPREILLPRLCRSRANRLL